MVNLDVMSDTLLWTYRAGYMRYYNLPEDVLSQESQVEQKFEDKLCIILVWCP